MYKSPSAGRIVACPENGDVVHLIDVILDAGLVSGKLTCSEESEEVRFLNRTAFRKALYHRTSSRCRTY